MSSAIVILCLGSAPPPTHPPLPISFRPRSRHEGANISTVGWDPFFVSVHSADHKGKRRRQKTLDTTNSALALWRPNQSVLNRPDIKTESFFFFFLGRKSTKEINKQEYLPPISPQYLFLLHTLKGNSTTTKDTHWHNWPCWGGPGWPPEAGGPSISFFPAGCLLFSPGRSSQATPRDGCRGLGPLDRETAAGWSHPPLSQHLPPSSR